MSEDDRDWAELLTENIRVRDDHIADLRTRLEAAEEEIECLKAAGDALADQVMAHQVTRARHCASCDSALAAWRERSKSDSVG